MDAGGFGARGTRLNMDRNRDSPKHGANDLPLYRHLALSIDLEPVMNRGC